MPSNNFIDGDPAGPHQQAYSAAILDFTQDFGSDLSLADSQEFSALRFTSASLKDAFRPTDHVGFDEAVSYRDPIFHRSCFAETVVISATNIAQCLSHAVEPFALHTDEWRLLLSDLDWVVLSIGDPPCQARPVFSGGGEGAGPGVVL